MNTARPISIANRLIVKCKRYDEKTDYLLLRHAGTDSLRKRHREKANEKLTIARAAYERGDYEEAKTQIDSIKILYPKAFEARKAGQELMLDVELKAQQEILAFWTVLSRQSKQRLTPSEASTPWRKTPNISK